jgi:hypothetical protein
MPGAAPIATTCEIEWTSDNSSRRWRWSWMHGCPKAPDLEEAPEGWHKFFDSFTICGEGECIKTLFTIYAPGKPRRSSVDLDEWEMRAPEAAEP